MTNKQIQLTLENGKISPKIDLIAFLQNRLGLNYNDRRKAFDLLISKDLFVELNNRTGVQKISTFGINILNEFGTYEKYVENESKKTARRKEKEKIEFEKSKTDLILAQRMLKEFPKTKFIARVGAFIALVLFIIKIIEMFYPDFI